MDERFEKVERLRRETGVSYEEARAAFETAGRDLLDALIALEKQGKARRRRQRAGLRGNLQRREECRRAAHGAFCGGRAYHTYGSG
jgi:translation elongation factor EF-Ts